MSPWWGRCRNNICGLQLASCHPRARDQRWCPLMKFFFLKCTMLWLVTALVWWILSPQLQGSFRREHLPIDTGFWRVVSLGQLYIHHQICFFLPQQYSRKGCVPEEAHFFPDLGCLAIWWTIVQWLKFLSVCRLWSLNHD